MTLSPEELRRVCALVSEGRAVIQGTRFQTHTSKWSPAFDGKTILVAEIGISVADVADVVCKTLTPQQAYEEAERDMCLAGERAAAIAAKLDPTAPKLKSAANTFTISPESYAKERHEESARKLPLRVASDPCGHEAIRLAPSVAGDTIVCDRCKRVWNRDGSS